MLGEDQAPSRTALEDERLRLSSLRLGGGGGAVIAKGDVDISTAELLAAELAPPKWQGCELVVADLRGVGFMDSSGLHVLISAFRQLAARAMRLALVVAPSSQVDRLFDLSALRSHLPVFASVDAAREQLSAPS